MCEHVGIALLNKYFESKPPPLLPPKGTTEDITAGYNSPTQKVDALIVLLQNHCLKRFMTM